jgi:periplasmic protein TonB
MTDAALGARAFEPPPLSPRWLRPAVIAIVIAFHAAALSILALTPKPPEPPGEVIVDIQPEAPPAETPAPPAEEPKPPEKSAAEPPPQPPQDVAPAPVEAPPPPVEAPPPVAEQPPPPIAAQPPSEKQPPVPPPEIPPPVFEQPPPPPPEEQPPLPSPETPPPPAPVELAPLPPRTIEARPPKPLPPLRVEAPKPQARPAAKPAAAPSAASSSAYIGEVSAAIRSRMFYPPAARGARGVVSVAFTIGQTGALASFAITRSSGDAELDAAARMLVQSAHFPPPPAGPVHIATSFNYVPR